MTLSARVPSQCAACKEMATLEVTQSVLDSHLHWHEHFSCACGHSFEAQGAGLPTPGLRRSLLTQTGTHQVWLDDAAGRPVVLRLLTRVFSLPETEAQARLDSLPALVFEGSGVEAGFIREALERAGVVVRVTTLRDGWNPSVYGNFRDARRQPYFDLLALVQPVEAPALLDAGCGTGELTLEAHRQLLARSTVGVDASPSMLGRAPTAENVTFMLGSVPESLPAGPFDVIVSNSTLNWVPNHRDVLAALSRRLAARGQLALQMPSNPHTAFSRAAVTAAQRFATELKGYVYESPVCEPEQYSQWLEELGFESQRVGAWFYPQRHESSEGVADFASGGLLSVYRQRLEPAAFIEFEKVYREELRRELGPGAVFFPFRRVFVWGRLRA